MEAPGLVPDPSSSVYYSASLSVSPGGRLWATWYAGPTPGEDENNYVVITTSADTGKTWTEVLVIDPDGQQTGDGSIYIIYDYSRTGDQHVLMTSFREEDVLSGDDKKMIDVFSRRCLVSNGGRE